MPESAKEGAEVLLEGSDIGLGSRDRGFESRSPDHAGASDQVLAPAYFIRRGVHMLPLAFPNQTHRALIWVSALSIFVLYRHSNQNEAPVDTTIGVSFFQCKPCNNNPFTPAIYFSREMLLNVRKVPQSASLGYYNKHIMPRTIMPCHAEKSVIQWIYLAERRR